MEKLEKVELVREKCNVSYEEAREALEKCDYDVLDAIVLIERAHKPVEPTTSFAEAAKPEAAQEETPVAEEVPMDEPEFEVPYESTTTKSADPKSSKVADAWKAFCATVKSLVTRGLEMTFVMERHGNRVLSLPVLILVIGMLAWGATIWLLIIGLFFGFRYHIEGAGAFTVDVNKVMDKAADTADEIKQNLV
jgi:uncharacterized membrane protein